MLDKNNLQNKKSKAMQPMPSSTSHWSLSIKIYRVHKLHKRFKTKLLDRSSIQRRKGRMDNIIKWTRMTTGKGDQGDKQYNGEEEGEEAYPIREVVNRRSKDGRRQHKT